MTHLRWFAFQHTILFKTGMIGHVCPVVWEHFYWDLHNSSTPSRFALWMLIIWAYALLHLRLFTPVSCNVPGFLLFLDLKCSSTCDFKYEISENHDGVMMKFLPRHSLDDADTNRHCKWFVQEFNYATSSQELEKKFLHFAVSSTWVLKKVLGKIWQSSSSYLVFFFF